MVSGAGQRARGRQAGLGRRMPTRLRWWKLLWGCWLMRTRRCCPVRYGQPARSCTRLWTCFVLFCK